MRDGIVIERTSCCRSSIQRSYTNRPGSPSSDRNRRGIAQRFDRPLLDQVVVEGFVVKHEKLHYPFGPGELTVECGLSTIPTHHGPHFTRRMSIRLALRLGPTSSETTHDLDFLRLRPVFSVRDDRQSDRRIADIIGTGGMDI
jgi:hypothetical protein